MLRSTACSTTPNRRTAIGWWPACKAPRCFCCAAVGMRPGATRRGSSRGSTVGPFCPHRRAWTSRPVFISPAKRDEEGRIMRTVLALLLAVIGLPAHAQCPPAYDWSAFYPPAALDRVTERTAPGLRSNFDQVILPQLTDQERRVLGGTTLDLDQRVYPAHPMNFYAAQGGRVVLPLSSVKLVSDLTMAVAWLNRHRLPEKKVFDYAAMLAFRGPAPDGVHKLPLAALGIPDEAQNDPEGVALFKNLHGDTMFFFWAHGRGHLSPKIWAKVRVEKSPGGGG